MAQQEDRFSFSLMQSNLKLYCKTQSPVNTCLFELTVLQYLFRKKYTRMSHYKHIYKHCAPLLDMFFACAYSCMRVRDCVSKSTWDTKSDLCYFSLHTCQVTYKRFYIVHVQPCSVVFQGICLINTLVLSRPQHLV